MEFGKNIKAVAFDFDGTLFHLDVDWSAVRQKLGGAPNDNMGKLIWRMIDEHDDKLEIITETELQSIGSRGFDNSTAKVLKFLSSRDVNIGVFTRNSRQAVEAVIRNSNMDESIEIVGREDVVKQKPDPDGLLKLVKQWGANIDEVLVVGDTIHDVEAARPAGIKVVIVENKRLDYRPEGADYYINNIMQLITEPMKKAVYDKD